MVDLLFLAHLPLKNWFSVIIDLRAGEKQGAIDAMDKIHHRTDH